MVKQFPLSRVAELGCWASKRQSKIESETCTESELQGDNSEEPLAKVEGITYCDVIKYIFVLLKLVTFRVRSRRDMIITID